MPPNLFTIFKSILIKFLKVISSYNKKNYIFINAFFKAYLYYCGLLINVSKLLRACSFDKILKGGG